MTINEVYVYFGKNWAECMRECNFSPYAYRYWLENSYIPMSTQIKIEHYTDGELKACELDHEDFDKTLARKRK